MGVITPAEGTFKRSEVLKRRDEYKREARGLGTLFWIGAAIAGFGLFAYGLIWLLLG